MPHAAPLESTLQLGKIMSMAPVLLGCHDRLRVTTPFTNPRPSPPPAIRMKSFPNTLESLEDEISPVIIAAAPILSTRPTNHLDAPGPPEFQTRRNPLHTTTTAMQLRPHRLEAAETAHHQRRHHAMTTRQRILMTELLAAANDRASHRPKHARATPTWTTTTVPRLDAQRQ